MKNPRSKSILIDFEGLDQSGKKTQTRLLARRMRRLSYEVATFDFPDYRTAVGRELRMALHGKRSYPIEARHMLFALNRWEKKTDLEQALKESITLTNRYIPSNLAYGMASGLSLEWLQSLDKGLPTPDLVLVLDITPRVSESRKLARRDIHERSSGFLRRVRENYLRLARRFHWKIIPGDASREKVHQAVWTYVESMLRKHRQ